MLDRFAIQRQRTAVAGKAGETARQDRHHAREPRAQRPQTPRESC